MPATASGPRRWKSISASSSSSATRSPGCPRTTRPGDKTGESVLYVDLRQFCQRRLAALPPEARAIYRNRVDAQAERWYRQGATEGDRGALRRVVEMAFCSSWGDDALELLGDLAFQDGRFAEAIAAYRQLVPDHPTARPGLIYPDPSVDLARVAAKKLLCRAALGDEPPTPGDLEAFAAAYPNAGGALAGRKGPYLDDPGRGAAFRRARAAGPARRPLADVRRVADADPGRPGHGRRRLVPVACRARAASRRAGPSSRRGGGRSAPIAADRLLAYHPIVLGDQVIVCDDDRILAYNLNERPEGAGRQPLGHVKEAWRHDEQPGTSVAPGRPVPRRRRRGTR